MTPLPVAGYLVVVRRGPRSRLSGGFRVLDNALGADMTDFIDKASEHDKLARRSTKVMYTAKSMTGLVLSLALKASDHVDHVLQSLTDDMSKPLSHGLRESCFTRTKW